MSFNALNALRGIDQLIEGRRAQGFGNDPQPDEIGSSALLVLYILAEYAGPEGRAFPSQKTLAKRCRLHDRTVRAILVALERWGFLTRVGRTRKDGTWTSDEILLTYYQPEQEVEPAGVRPAGTRKRSSSGATFELKGGDQRVSDPEDQRLISTEPAGVTPDPTTFEPVTETVTVPDEREIAEGCDKFWAIYPCKAEERASRAIFRRKVSQGEATVDEMIAGARHYANEVRGREPKFVKHATTWLHNRCWTAAAKPSSANGSGSVDSFPRTEFAGPSEIRAAVVEVRGEAWARSWIDPSGWDADAKQIIPRSAFAGDRIRQELGRHLRAWGLSVGEPERLAS